VYADNTESFGDLYIPGSEQLTKIGILTDLKLKSNPLQGKVNFVIKKYSQK